MMVDRYPNVAIKELLHISSREAAKSAGMLRVCCTCVARVLHDVARAPDARLAGSADRGLVAGCLAGWTAGWLVV